MYKKKIIWEVLFPEVLKEWNYEKNIITPKDSTTYSKVWWKCSKGHEWLAKINNRIRGRGCPYCHNHLACNDNNLFRSHPSLKKIWNHEKNKGIDPLDILPKSTKNFWWICDKGHEWQSSPHQITNARIKKYGCPYCAGLKPSTENNIMDMKQLLKEWHYAKNGGVVPEQMTRGKRKKVWWKCRNGHEWRAAIANRVNGTGCPYCKKPHSLLEVRIYSELKYITKAKWGHNQNGHEIDVYLPSYRIGIEIDGSYWHKNKYKLDLEKNNAMKKEGITIIRLRELPLRKISKFDECHKHNESHGEILKKICLRLFHITNDKRFEEYVLESKIRNQSFYESQISSITSFEENIAKVKPSLSKEWDYQKNGFLKPENVSYGSGQKIWWKCNLGHSWQTSAKNRVSGNNCPYCHGRVASPENNLKKSYPDLCKEWHPTLNGLLTPEQFRPKSNKYAWWLLPNNTPKMTRINDKVRSYLRKRKKHNNS